MYLLEILAVDQYLTKSLHIKAIIIIIIIAALRYRSLFQYYDQKETYLPFSEQDSWQIARFNSSLWGRGFRGAPGQPRALRQGWFWCSPPSRELRGKCSRHRGAPLGSSPRSTKTNKMHSASPRTHRAAASRIDLIELHPRKIENCIAALEASWFSWFNMQSICLIQSVAGSFFNLLVALMTTTKAHVPFLNLG